MTRPVVHLVTTYIDYDNIPFSAKSLYSLDLLSKEVWSKCIL